MGQDIQRSVRSGWALLVALIGFSVWNAYGVNVGFQIMPPSQMLIYFLFLLTVFVGLLGTQKKAFSPPDVSSLHKWMQISLGVMVADCLFSITYAPETFEVIRYTARYVQGMMLLYMMVAWLRSDAEVSRCIWWLLAGATVCALVGGLAVVVPAIGNFAVDPAGRVMGLMNHPNQFAMMLAAMVPLALAQMMKKWQGIGWWLVLGAILGGVAISGSKLNLLLALANIWVFFAVVNMLRGKYATFMVGSFLLGIVCVGGFYAAMSIIEAVSPVHFERFQDFFRDPMGQFTTLERIEMWQIVLDYVPKTDYLGVGAGHTLHVLWLVHAHNVFIDIYLNLGAPGLVILSLMLLTMIRIVIGSLRSASDKRTSQDMRYDLIGAALGVVSYLVSNQFSDSFGAQTILLLWVLVGLNLALQRCSIAQRS